MDKKTYFFLCLNNGAALHKSWIISTFALPVLGEYTGEHHYPGKLYKDEIGYYTHLEDTEKPIRIESKDAPLFSHDDIWEVSNKEVPNLHKKVKSHPGRLLFNYLLLIKPFGVKIDYMGEKLAPKAIDKILWYNLVDDNTKNPGHRDILTSEMDYYVSHAIEYINQFSMVFTTVATEHNILPPPGLKAFKKKLLKKYEGQLEDPIKQTEFEAELEDFAREYLKDDPTYGKLMVGKMWQSYKKMYLTYGSATSFGGMTAHRPEGLMDDMPSDAATMADAINNLRYGSAMRGIQTQKGGVVPKILQGAASHYRTVEKDCKTKDYLKIRINTDIKKWEGTYLAGSTKKLDISKVKIGDEIKVRMPTVCKSPGATFCRYCTGDGIFDSDKSIGLLLNNLGALVLYQSMKGFHATNLVTTEVDLLNYID